MDAKTHLIFCAQILCSEPLGRSMEILYHWAREREVTVQEFKILLGAMIDTEVSLKVKKERKRK